LNFLLFYHLFFTSVLNTFFLSQVS